jgi:hypothetical protein
MRSAARALAILGVWIAVWSGASIRDASAEGTVRRTAILVGNNDGGPGLAALLYAESDARAMADVLHTRGGFEQPTVLLGRTADEVVAAVERARNAVGPGSLFVLYYSGHADAHGLRLGGTQLSHERLDALLAGIPSDMVLALVDACHAGVLTGMKGGTAEAVELDLRFLGDREVRGRAVIASATANETAHEYPDLGGSLFTSALIRGLLGAADTSRDHQVSLREAYDYAFERTRDESVSRGQSQRPNYRFNLEGAGDVVLTLLPAVGGYLHFPVEATGRYDLRDARSGRVVTHVLETEPRPFRIHLGAGVYSLHAPVSGRLQRVHTVVVEAGRDTTGWHDDGEYRQVDGRGRKGADGAPLFVTADAGVRTPIARDATWERALSLGVGRALAGRPEWQIGAEVDLGLSAYETHRSGETYNAAVTQATGSVRLGFMPLILGRVAWQSSLALGGGVAYQAMLADDGDVRNVAALGRAGFTTGPAFLLDTWQLGFAGVASGTLIDRGGTTVVTGLGGMLRWALALTP